MRVTAFVSSPRKGGNSELAAKEMLRCLPEDWEKNIVRVNELNIEPCRACYSCIKEGAKCVIKDDFDFIVRNIKHSDKIIFTAPAYMLGFHGGMKKVADRLISLTSDYKRFNPTDCVFAGFYGMGGWEGMLKEDMIVLARKMHLKLLGSEVLFATIPGDSVQGENLEKLRGLAKLLETGSDQKPAPTSEALECPYCTSTALHIMPDGRIRCGICAGEGKLVQGPAGFEIEYDPSDETKCHFLPAATQEHLDWLQEKKRYFLDNRAKVKEIQAEYAKYDWNIKP